MGWGLCGFVVKVSRRFPDSRFLAYFAYLAVQLPRFPVVPEFHVLLVKHALDRYDL